jgi:methylsterol monooxygenase
MEHVLNFESLCGVGLAFVLWRAAGNTPYSIILILAVLNFPQTLWTRMVGSLDPIVLQVGITQLIFFLTYWVHGGLYLILDVTRQPTFLYKYKIQPNRSLDTSKILKVVKNVVMGQAFIAVPVAYIFYKYVDRIRLTDTLPKHSEMLGHFLGFALIEEVLFYYSHALLHTDFFYRRFHKIHHEFQSPSSICAAYCHPLEMLLSNVLPVAIGPSIMGAHTFTNYTWILFAILATHIGHCGYHFPWNGKGDSKVHDYHHEKFKVNYGLGLGFLDWLHGTAGTPP